MSRGKKTRPFTRPSNHGIRHAINLGTSPQDNLQWAWATFCTAGKDTDRKERLRKTKPRRKGHRCPSAAGLFFLWQVTVTNPHPRILQITQPKLGRNLRGKINARRIGYRSAKLVFPAIVSSEISRFSLRFTQCQIRKLSSGIGVVRCIPIIVVFIPRAYFPNQHIKNSFIRRFVINIRRIRRVLVIRFNGIGNVAPPPEISKLHIFVGQCNLIFSNIRYIVSHRPAHDRP